MGLPDTRNYYKRNPQDGSLWYYSGKNQMWQKAVERENPQDKSVWVYWNDEWMPRDKAIQTPGAHETAKFNQQYAIETQIASDEKRKALPGIASDTAAAIVSAPFRQIRRVQSKARALGKVLGGDTGEQAADVLMTYGNPIAGLAAKIGPDYEAERIMGQAVQFGGDIAGDVAPIAAASAVNPVLGAAVAGGTSAGSAAENVQNRTDMSRLQKVANVAGHGAIGGAMAMIPGGPGGQMERLAGRSLGSFGLPLEQSLGKQAMSAGLGVGLEGVAATTSANLLDKLTGAAPADTSVAQGFGRYTLIPAVARLGRGFNVQQPFVPLSERGTTGELVAPQAPSAAIGMQQRPSIGMRQRPTITEAADSMQVEGGPIMPEYIPPGVEPSPRVPPVVMDVPSTPGPGYKLGAPGQPVGMPDPMAERSAFSKAILKPSRAVQKDPILYGPAYQAILDAVEERSKFQARYAEPLKTAGRLSRAEMKQLSRAVLTPEFRKTGVLTEGIALNDKQKQALSAIVEGNRRMGTELINALDQAASEATGSGGQQLKAVADKFRAFQQENPGYIRLIREGDWEKRVSYLDPQTNQPVTVAMLRGNSKKDVEDEFKKFLAQHPDIAEAITTNRAMTTDPVKIVKGDYPSSPDASKVARALEDAGLPKGYAAQVASAYDDIVLGEGFNKFAAAQKRARFVPGFTEDIGEAYKSSIGLMGNKIIQLGPGRKALGEIQKVGSQKNPQGQPAYSESEKFLQQVYDQAMSNPLAQTQAGRLALAARSVNFMRQMGMDPGAAVQQIMQKGTHDVPTMLSDYGPKGLVFWSRGNRLATEVLSSPKMKSGAITPTLAGDPPAGVSRAEWVKELQDLVKSELDSSLLTSEAMQDIRSYSSSPLLRGAEKATEMGGFIMNKTETHNRLATLLGNYIAARKAGFPVEPGVTQASQLGRSTGAKYLQLSPEEASVLARRRTGEVNNMGGSINLSPVERTPVGSLLTQYRFFPVEYVQQLRANYRNVADRYKNMGATNIGAHIAAMGPTGAALSATMAGAGTRGIPYLLTAWAAAKGLRDTIGFNPDEPPSKPVERQIEEFGRKQFEAMGLKGQEVDDLLGVFKRGLPHAFNLELSGRLGLADPLNIKDAKSPSDLALTAGGPTVGTAKDVLRAAELGRQGDAAGALKSVLGRSVGNVVSAFQGEAKGKGGAARTMDTGERILKGLGLRTAEAGDVADLGSERYYEESQLNEWAKDYGKRVGRAYNQGGPGGIKGLVALFKEKVRSMGKEGRGYAVEPVMNQMISAAVSSIQNKAGYTDAQIKQMIYEAIRNPEKPVKRK